MATKKKPITKDEPASTYFARVHGPLTLGRALRSIRQCDEETLATFAKRLGVSVAFLSDVEHGRRAVSVERAAAWAKLMSFPPALFIELALQEAVDAAGVRVKVSVKAA